MKNPVILLSLFLASALSTSAQAPRLQTASSFAVLAGSGITNADAGTTIVGDVGSSPTPTVTGLLASQVTGKLYTPAYSLTSPKEDLTLAYTDALRRNCPATNVLTGVDLGGLNLGPGVYCFSSSALLTGTLTLRGSSSDVWIFQIGSSLTTATGASVAFAGGASPCNVFWEVGSSATIQVGNNFAGTIMAGTSITLNGGTLTGRALARSGAVTISGKETIINGCGPPPPPIIVALSPATSSIICGAPGSTITKTAVVLSSSGLPVVGTLVTFTIAGGPDAGKEGTATTDASGTASFTFTGPFSLTASAADSIVATVGTGPTYAGSNTTYATCSGSTSGAFCSTAPSPTVNLTAVTAGPPKQVVLSVQSTGGLSSVVVNTPPTTNATVVISPFDAGTTLAVGVTATKINQSSSAVIELTVTDLCGHTTVFDPVFATITIPRAGRRSRSQHVAKFDFDHWEVARFDGIGHTEGIVFLQNDIPGVESLVITVNGTQFRTKLADGKSKKIDISSALFHGTNKVTIAVFGDTGSSVDLSISDGK
jgi:hypothetical protein